MLPSLFTAVVRLCIYVYLIQAFLVVNCTDTEYLFKTDKSNKKWNCKPISELTLLLLIVEADLRGLRRLPPSLPAAPAKPSFIEKNAIL